MSEEKFGTRLHDMLQKLVPVTSNLYTVLARRLSAACVIDVSEHATCDAAAAADDDDDDDDDDDVKSD